MRPLPRVLGPATAFCKSYVLHALEGTGSGDSLRSMFLRLLCVPFNILTTIFREGGDIHIAIDATFSQRHNAAAGESPWFYEPKYFIPKEDIDRIDARIAAARKKPPRSHQCEVPDGAIDECEKSYEAADERKEKTHGLKFDDTGLMAMVCRHDTVLFLANIDTPGEQQKFGIALIERLFSHLPPEATVAVFYDIGCVMDRSLHQVRGIDL